MSKLKLIVVVFALTFNFGVLLCQKSSEKCFLESFFFKYDSKMTTTLSPCANSLRKYFESSIADASKSRVGDSVVDFALENMKTTFKSVYFAITGHSLDEDTETKIRNSDVIRLAQLITSAAALVQNQENPPMFADISITNAAVKDLDLFHAHLWAGLQPNNILSSLRNKSKTKYTFKEDKSVSFQTVELSVTNDKSYGLSAVVSQSSKDRVGRLVFFNKTIVSPWIELEHKLLFGNFVHGNFNETTAGGIAIKIMDKMADDAPKMFALQILDGKIVGLVIKMLRFTLKKILKISPEFPEINDFCLASLD